MTFLEIDGLHVYYGKSHILQGVSFIAERGEIVSVLGRNGSGRSTTLKAIMGLVPPSNGHILLQGENIAGRRPFEIVHGGISYVPEERLIFDNLTTQENLIIGQQPGKREAPKWTIDQMYEYFPRLAQRRNAKAGTLSGGEKQMLTICRSLLGNPILILIDEPTEGMAPQAVDVVMQVILRIQTRGVTVLLVEQKLTIALDISDRVLVMGHGKIVFEGTPKDIKGDEKIRKEWLEVG
ncbi:MAG: ABC transporter ATP-binding protein [Thermodesulfobacteriota bacterium]|jgi:branched-chain amino acid transport system ATP-binding protein